MKTEQQINEDLEFYDQCKQSRETEVQQQPKRMSDDEMIELAEAVGQIPNAPNVVALLIEMGERVQTILRERLSTPSAVSVFTITDYTLCKCNREVSPSQANSARDILYSDDRKSIVGFRCCFCDNWIAHPKLLSTPQSPCCNYPLLKRDDGLQCERCLTKYSTPLSQDDYEEGDVIDYEIEKRKHLESKSQDEFATGFLIFCEFKIKTADELLQLYKEHLTNGK